MIKIKDFNTFLSEELNSDDKKLANSVISKEVEVGDNKTSITDFELQNGTKVEADFLKYAIEKSEDIDTFKKILYKKYGDTSITNTDMSTFMLYFNKSKIK